jgi:GNAT superfamily N-acetyltransferase
MRIRPARPSDVARLQEIERNGGEAFRDIGMPEIADDQPFTDAEFGVAFRVWVAADDDDVAIAYLLSEVMDGNLHIEQLTVDPAAARRGVGAALIEHAAHFATEAGFPALTLTTFAEVPWNAPYYRRLGFDTLDDIGPELAAVRRREAAHGLDRWPRVCMIRPLA